MCVLCLCVTIVNRGRGICFIQGGRNLSKAVEKKIQQFQAATSVNKTRDRVVIQAFISGLVVIYVN